MRYLIILIGLVLTSCSTNTERQKSNEFELYLATLEELRVPSNSILSVRSDNYDTALWTKFKHGSGSSWPCGKIFFGDSVVMTIEIGVGDILWPSLMTYDRAGLILDRLSPYKRTGIDIGYESSEYLAIDTKGDIMVIDSTTTWDINSTGDDIVDGTQKLTVDTVIYRIDKDGKFNMVKD